MCWGFAVISALVLRSINMTLWGDHLYFRKPEWSEWPVTIHYLPVVSLELFTSSSGSVHHLPDDFEQGTLLQMPEILNVCILNHRKYLQLCVNLLRKQLTTHFFFLLSGCIIINQSPLKKAGGLVCEYQGPFLTWRLEVVYSKAIRLGTESQIMVLDLHGVW